MRRCFAFAILVLTGCGGATVVPEAHAPEEEAPERYGIALRFEEAEPDETDTPRTRALLVRITPDGRREATDLAVELGACLHEDAREALIAARCWWGGAGALYEVHRVEDAVVALRAELDEESGTGEPAEVGRVEVPRDARLDVLLPGRSTHLEE
jgi:hypothetical protein